MRSSFRNLTEKLSLNTGLRIPAIFEQKYIPSLNGLRALAILFVLADHAKYARNCPSIFYSFSNYLPVGSFGVQIFFVISGFLITGLLLKEKVKTGTIDLKKFWLRRAIRIMPAFYFFIFVIILLKYQGIAVVDNKPILAALLFSINFLKFNNSWLVGHSWSLAVEEQFYLFWPLILIFVPRKYYFILIGILLYNLLYYYLRHYHFLFVLRFFLVYAPSIMTGALLSIALFKDWFKKAHHQLMRPIFAFSFIFAIIIYLPRAFQVAAVFYIPLDYTLSSIFIGIFLYYAINCSREHLLYRILNFSVLSYIGILSYSIYLWQQPFFATTDTYHVYPYWTEFPKNLILTLMAALISYYLIEKPFIRLKNISNMYVHSD